MSLYGGIFSALDGKPADAQGASPAPPSAAASTSAPGGSTPLPETEKPKAAWSAALRFAPTIRKRPAPSSGSSSVPLAFKSAFGSAEDPASSPSGPRIVGRAKPALSNPTIIAPPSLLPIPSAQPPPAPEPVFAARQGRVLKPPSMTIDDDVNGFRQTTVGKKAATKKGKGKKGAKKEDPALAFTSVAYDPSRPCDYSAYKLHVQVTRAQRRNEREEELRRARSPSGSSYDGSSDGERSDEGERSNKKARFFAPPTSYDNTPSSGSGPPQPTVLEAPAAPPPREESGEEAYQRRLAMSQGGRPALPPPPPPPPQSFPTFTPASRPPPPGPQACPSFSPARTMSAGPQVYPPPSVIAGPQAYPSFAPASSPASYGPSAYPPPPPPSFLPPPGFSAPPSGPPPSFIPSHLPLDGSPSYHSPPVFNPAAGGPPAASLPLSDAAAKARDIAQRLSKLAGLQPPPPPPPAPSAPAEYDSRPFADRMMSKFGWKEGQGLGVDESGMTAALSVSKPSTPSAKKGKGKGKNKDEGAAAPAPVGMAKSRGTIVDASRESRVEKQTAQIGEPSRVVLLTNLCGLDDVDDDLGGEVAEEANKFGVVERCFVYLVPGETRDDEGVRIFLVMSGLAGGYNAVRQFDGRFFGGRVVKARFYDEATFNAGEHRM